MVAAAMGRTGVVRLLLNKGADSNVKDRVKMTALDYAKMMGRQDIINIIQESNPVDEKRHP
jgi:ankyrin repeat protein